MLYYLFDWLDKAFDFPGAGVFQYISFRASMAVITSLIITIVFGKPIKVGDDLEEANKKLRNEIARLMRENLKK